MTTTTRLIRWTKHNISHHTADVDGWHFDIIRTAGGHGFNVIASKRHQSIWLARGVDNYGVSLEAAKARVRRFLRSDHR